jgi:hypothetical protein
MSEDKMIYPYIRILFVEIKYRLTVRSVNCFGFTAPVNLVPQPGIYESQRSDALLVTGPRMEGTQRGALAMGPTSF